MLTQESTAATTMPVERLEAEITELAGHLIAVHMEKIVRAYRHVTTAAEACAEANALHAARYLRHASALSRCS